jgi:hypothetical protein
VPTNDPQIDAVLDAVFDSIRRVVSDLQAGGDEDARVHNMELFHQLTVDHVQGTAVVAATLLAEAAANGFTVVARGTREPVENILAIYEEQLREHTDFTVIIGREFFLDEDE